jgi:hypothetical protein
MSSGPGSERGFRAGMSGIGAAGRADPQPVVACDQGSGDGVELGQHRDERVLVGDLGIEVSAAGARCDQGEDVLELAELVVALGVVQPPAAGVVGAAEIGDRARGVEAVLVDGWVAGPGQGRDGGGEGVGETAGQDRVGGRTGRARLRVRAARRSAPGAVGRWRGRAGWRGAVGRRSWGWVSSRGRRPWSSGGLAVQRASGAVVHRSACPWGRKASSDSDHVWVSRSSARCPATPA